MTEIINLNKARKNKLKQQKKVQAKENRVIYGVPAKVRQTEMEKRKRELATLEGKRLDNSEDNKKVDENQ